MDVRIRRSLLAFVTFLTGGSAARVTAAPPPAPWKTLDIGVANLPGTTDVDARGVWTLRASQGGSYLSADAFYFAYQPLSGDGSIVTLLLDQQGGDPEVGRAGVMIAEREAVRTRGVALHMTSGRGLAVVYRTQELETLVTESGDQRYGPRRFPTWLRLQREGDRFTPFTSSDGFGWTQLRSPITLANFPKTALAGVAVASADFEGGPVSGVFNNPVVAPGLVSPIVQACTGNGAVLLTWPPVSGAIGYLVRRSTPTTPGFAAELVTPNPIQETSFADANRPIGAPTRYLISALFGSRDQPVEGWPTAIIVTPTAVPGDLSGCDINLDATQLRGGISFDPNTQVYRVSGAGSGVNDDEDHLFYASRLVSGDFQITARILDKGAKAGVMIRETLEGPSRMAFLAGTPASGVLWQYRKQTGAKTMSFAGAVIDGKSFKPPLFLRLVRKGNVITAFVSTDGTLFTLAGTPQSFDPPLAESLYVGYGITSQNAGAIATNSFRDLTIGPPPPP